MILEKLKMTEPINPNELGAQSARSLINLFHILSLIHSDTTRKHTPEFVLYKTQEFLKDAIPWINAMTNVDEELEKELINSIAANARLFAEDSNNINKIIEFVTINLMYNDSKARLDIFDYTTVLLSLVIYKYAFSLDQIFLL
jgi:hypothetical protein